jgi:hypothetical protein
MVVLSWPAPTFAGQVGSKFYIARADIYRLTELRDQLPTLDPDDYEELSQLVKSIDRQTMESQAQSLGHLEVADPLNLRSAPDLSKIRVRYAIRYVNSHDQAAGFSNSVSIEPFATVSSQPSNLVIAAPRQDVVELHWNAPDSNVDGTRPAAVVGYNIYRKKADANGADQLLNDTPVADTTFIDSKFQYKVEYRYFVRAVSSGATGLIESADSVPANFIAIDNFPPVAPEPVSIASANGVISLFWPTNAEGDVIGYNVYRADSVDAAPEGWVKLTAQPVATTTFRDERVVIDRAYWYRVTAVDRFENESKPSHAVSETAHP